MTIITNPPSTVAKFIPSTEGVDMTNLESIRTYAKALETAQQITISPNIDQSGKQRMLNSLPYDAWDPVLSAERNRAKELMRLYNATTESASDLVLRRALLELLLVGQLGSKCWIEPPFYMDYGCNLSLGTNVYMNFGCVVLDCAKIEIGSNTFLAPNVQIYAATHPVDPIQRRKLEMALPVKIGDDCWIGGNAVICPGITIGDGVTVAAGSVVTKNVPDYCVVGGNPAKILKMLDREECEKNGEREDALKAKGINPYEGWTNTPKGTLVFEPKK